MSQYNDKAQQNTLQCLEALADCDLASVNAKRMYDGSLMVEFDALSQYLPMVIDTDGRLEMA